MTLRALPSGLLLATGAGVLAAGDDCCCGVFPCDGDTACSDYATLSSDVEFDVTLAGIAVNPGYCGAGDCTSLVNALNDTFRLTWNGSTCSWIYSFSGLPSCTCVGATQPQSIYISFNDSNFLTVSILFAETGGPCIVYWEKSIGAPVACEDLSGEVISWGGWVTCIFPFAIWTSSTATVTAVP